MSCKHIFSSFTSHPRFTKPRFKKQTPSPHSSKLKKWRLNQTSGKNIQNKSAKSFTWKKVTRHLSWSRHGRNFGMYLGGLVRSQGSHAEGQSQGQVTRFFYRFFFRWFCWGQFVVSKKWVVHQYDVQWQKSKNHVCTYSIIQYISIESCTCLSYRWYMHVKRRIHHI